MKTTTFYKLCLLFVAVLIPACSLVTFTSDLHGSGVLKTESRPVSGFERVEVSGIGELILTQGETEALEIEAEDNLLQYIESEVSDGTLHLGIKSVGGRNFQPTKTITYRLTVKTLTDLEISGAVKAEVGPLEGALLDIVSSGAVAVRLDTITLTGDLRLESSGAGSITTGAIEAPGATDIESSGAGSVEIDSLQSASLAISISGGGNVRIGGGQVERQKVDISGAGSFKAGELQSKIADFEISGAGSATVWVTETLDAQISGVGNLEYYGKPGITIDDSGAGSLQSLGEK